MRDERRRAPRHAVEGLAGTLRLVSKVEILNISVTGMAARTSTHLRVGQTCDLRLEHGARSLRLPGTVVWARLVSFAKTPGGESAPVYQVGIEFQDMLSDRAREFLGLLGETAVISLESRIGGRFEIAERAPADLVTAAELLVQKISTNGVLVETEVGPETDQELDLELELGPVRFTCRGRVAYVEPREPAGGAADAAKPPVLVGIEFLGLGPAERGTLEAFVAERLG